MSPSSRFDASIPRDPLNDRRSRSSLARCPSSSASCDSKRSTPVSSAKSKDISDHLNLAVGTISTWGSSPRRGSTTRMWPGLCSSPFWNRSFSGVPAYQWFAGTPENHRFQKGEEQRPGHILVVEPRRGELPHVEMVPTARLRWSEISFDFADDTGVDRFESQLAEELGQRANEDLLRLSLSGSLGIEASNRLEGLIDSLKARLLRLKVDNHTAIVPTDDEVEALTRQTSDPLIATVAQQLVDMASSAGDDEAEPAIIALRELHAVYQQEGRS